MKERAREACSVVLFGMCSKEIQAEWLVQYEMFSKVVRNTRLDYLRMSALKKNEK
jgi:hypothetical protein